MTWAATLRADARLIGFIGLSTPTFLPEVLPAVEIGWRLGREHWGHGLATEGAAAALADGFSRLGVEQILGIYQPANVASRRVMEKLGMTYLRDTVDPTHGFPLRIYRAGSDVRPSRQHFVSADRFGELVDSGTLDEGFLADVRALREAAEPPEDPWQSSSTPMT